MPQYRRCSSSIYSQAYHTCFYICRDNPAATIQSEDQYHAQQQLSQSFLRSYYQRHVQYQQKLLKLHLLLKMRALISSDRLMKSRFRKHFCYLRMLIGVKNANKSIGFPL